MTAMTLEATTDVADPVRKTISRSPGGKEFRARAKYAGRRSELPIAAISGLSCALDLSKSRANDTVLDIIGAFDKVTYQIEPNPKLSHSPDWPGSGLKPLGGSSRFAGSSRSDKM
jgi:hypothetical protein